MRIEMLLGDGAQRSWHGDLLRGLRELPGAEVTVRVATGNPGRPRRRLEALLALERLLHRVRPGALEPGGESLVAEEAAPEDAAADDADLVIDLTDSPASGHWSVLYDGRPGEEAAVDALRAGRQPVVTVVDSAGAIRAKGRPGSENPGLLVTALADLCAGTTTLVLGAVAGRPFAEPFAAAPDREAERASPRPFALIAARRVAGAAIRTAYRLAFRAPHWRVGWRRVEGPDALGTGRTPEDGWRDVPDDGMHFYADPFLFEHEGATYLFVEDFDHRAGKAVISAVRFGPDGPEGTPVPVLAHDVHLSYPCVLAHDGEVWMIPETSGAGTVELYRATEFPWRWERHAVLISGVTASDATPFQHGGRWWLSATVAAGGSFSDSLCLWSAPDLRGPWTPHAANPVLVDIASARPAGHVGERNGRILRPTQDGRTGYGAAMTVAEITRLDDEAFEQRVVAEHRAGRGWEGSRIHTLNSCGGLEVVDGSRLVRRFRRIRREARDSGFTVEREDDFDFLGAEYAELYARSICSAFQHGVWLDNVYRKLAPARKAHPCVVTVRTAGSGELVAVLPLVRHRSGPVGVVEFADLGVADYNVPVVHRDWELALLGDTVVPLRIREALGAFDLLRVERTPERALSIAVHLMDARTRAHPYGTHPVTLGTDFAAWRSGLERRTVRQMDSRYKRLRPKGGHAFRVVTDPDEIDGLLRALRDFRAFRFGERGGTDLFQQPDFFEFYRSIAHESIGGSGPATLNVLDVGGRPAAIALDLAEPDRELYVITGYDFEGLRNYSLGLLIVDQIARAAVDRGASTLDLTVGDEPYKASFGSNRRPLFQVYVARTPLGSALFTGTAVYRWARRTAKRALVSWRKRRG